MQYAIKPLISPFTYCCSTPCWNIGQTLEIADILLVYQNMNTEQKSCLVTTLAYKFHFYRAIHFSAKRCLAIACRLSVRLSVTLVDCDHIGWNYSEIISPLVILGCSLSAYPNIVSGVYSKGNTRKFWPKVTHPLLIWASDTFDRKLRPNGYR